MPLGNLHRLPDRGIHMNPRAEAMITGHQLREAAQAERPLTPVRSMLMQAGTRDAALNASTPEVEK